MFDPYASMQTAARVLGHMTTLTMSFLTYPMARNSVWEAVWGIPFERGVRYHRALGRLTWGLVTLHMALWQIKWAREGALAPPPPPPRQQCAAMHTLRPLASQAPCGTTS